MPLPISQIVNVQLNNQPRAQSRRNFGMLAIFTPEAGDVFTGPSVRYIEAAQQSDVEARFGTYSKTAEATRPFFAQSPRPTSLIIARWQKQAASIAPVAAQLRGGVSVAPVEQFLTIADGQFSVRLDGVDVVVSALDFTGIATMDGVASVIDSKLSELGFGCAWDAIGKRLLITSQTPGSASSVGYAMQGEATGTYVGAMLALESGQATIVPGADGVDLAAETLPEAFAQLEERTRNWYAVAIADDLTDEQIESASDWIQASGPRCIGFTTAKAQHIEFDDANVFKRLYDKGNDRTIAIYSKTGPYAIVSWLARALAVNPSAAGSMITMKFKTLPGVPVDELTLTEVRKCQALGINYYAYFEDVGITAEGTSIGGRFFDEIFALDWFIDATQIEVFNTLRRANKVPQTDEGMHLLIAGVKRVGAEGRRNGAFAPGVWTREAFGTLETGDYLDEGYYVWADSIDNQSDADREARKATPILVALKLAGAFHSVDVIVAFNR